MSAAGGDGPAWVDVVARYYLESGDFNGMPVSARIGEADVASIEAEVLAGQLQVVTEAVFINPHIRPWADVPTAEDQAVLFRDAVAEGRTACLYPTRLAMAGDSRLADFADRSWERRLAEGAGALDLAYFTLDVLENYRNDPRRVR